MLEVSCFNQKVMNYLSTRYDNVFVDSCHSAITLFLSYWKTAIPT